MKPTSVHTLRAAAAHWLIKKAGCCLVTTEQGVDGRSRPDVLGCTSDGKLVEIEIKLTFADFKQNERKGMLLDRRWNGLEPSYFYFLAPSEVAQELFTKLPAASENPNAKVLSSAEMLALAVGQTQRFTALLAQVAKLEGDQ